MYALSLNIRPFPETDEFELTSKAVRDALLTKRERDAENARSVWKEKFRKSKNEVKHLKKRFNQKKLQKKISRLRRKLEQIQRSILEKTIEISELRSEARLYKIVTKLQE